MTSKTIYKIAILNDLLGLELSKIDIDRIIDPKMKSKLKNMKRTTDIFTEYVDELFKDQEVQETFGEFCDNINDTIEEKLKIIE